jgi:hypothetical protein
MIAGKAFGSKKLATCDDSAMTLFFGLITKADDEGREEGDTLTLKFHFPNRRWTEAKIDSMMHHLSEVGLINWYSCGCGIFYEVIDFEEYQQGSWTGLHKKESTFPQSNVDNCPQCMTATTMVHGCYNHVAKIREVKISKDKVITLYDDDFEEWWKTYPRKVGKVKASTCYVQLRSEGVPADLLADALTAYTDELRDNDTETRFVKHAATFLGPDKHYEDYARMKGWGEK